MSLVQSLFARRTSSSPSPTAARQGANVRVSGPAPQSVRRIQESSYHRFSSLIEFGTRFYGADDVAPVMEQTLRAAVKELEADLGYVMLLDQSGMTLRSEVAVSIGMERDFPETLGVYDGIEGHVTQSCQTYIAAKGDKSAGEINFDFDGEALLCVPLIKRQRDGENAEACGTLTIVRHRKRRAFRPSDETVAESLAALVTVSVANASNYRTLRVSFIRSLQAMACAVEAKVPFMEGHAARVAEVCRAIGERLQVDPEVLNDLQDGALLHEIGKIGIADTILLKPGQLTPEEFTALKQYPIIGYEMCRPLGLSDQLLTLIRNHPERLDGTGYPDRLKYGELPLPLRILCVADAFDAMSSYRPYRQGMDSRARHEQLNRFAGTQFDPIVVETLKGLLNDGQLEDLYQEHWAKYAGTKSGSSTEMSTSLPMLVPAPAAASMSLVSERSDDNEIEDISATSQIASELDEEIDFAPPKPGMFLNGERNPEKDQSYLTIDDSDGSGMTLEEAAAEAAAFASAALEAAQKDKPADKAA